MKDYLNVPSTVASSAVEHQAKAGAMALRMFGSIALKQAKVEQVAGHLLAAGLLNWLAKQSEDDRAQIFVAIEAEASLSEAKKIALHPLRPMIDEARIDVERAAIEQRKDVERAEKDRAREEAQRRREDERATREQAKLDKERALYEELRARFAAESNQAAVIAKQPKSD